MDELIQQECLVESQIETYKSQLSLVEQQLEFGGDDAGTSDLQQLKSDLSELISLTQDSLLEIKKQKLLLIFQGAIGNTSAAPSSSSSSSSITTVPTRPEVMCSNGTERSSHQEGKEEKREEEENKAEEEEEEEDDDLLGTRCKAPLKEAWGAVNYHNAIIISREIGGSSSPDHSGENLVTVLFTHPTYNGMKPCPFYLEGRCNFDKQSCKFSHGHVVPFSELQPFQDPDFSLAHVGGKSLAKYTDGIWHPAVISAVGELFTVHFSTLNATAQLEPDCVLPLESSDESETSESDSSSEGEEEVRVLEWKPTGAQQALGEWEKYTTGIGSRLLAKMGYVVGKGLGKDGQGQVSPVEIVILPVGKSLDVCAEMREAKKLRKPLGQAATKRRKKKKRILGDGSHQQQQQQSEESDIFNFLNTKIFRKDHKVSNEFPIGKDSKARSSSQRGRENLNVKLFKVHEEMKSVKKRMQSLQKSLLRQKGSRDKNMETHVQEKLAVCERHLSQLQRDERTIQRNITSKSERKKLAVF